MWLIKYFEQTYFNFIIIDFTTKKGEDTKFIDNLQLSICD